MALHDPKKPYRKPLLVSAVLLAMLVGIVGPGQPLGLRLSAPFMVLFAFVAGYLVGWLVLKFQVLVWGRVAPGPLRALCLAFFYLFLIGTLVNALLYPLMAKELREEGFTMASFALMLPSGIGAALGALRVYVQLQSEAVS